MNERIKELWEQCKTDSWSYDNQTYDHEKFAELLVRECANAADMAQDAGCIYAGDYVAEYMGFGEAEGVAEWRSK